MLQLSWIYPSRGLFLSHNKKTRGTKSRAGAVLKKVIQDPGSLLISGRPTLTSGFNLMTTRLLLYFQTTLLIYISIQSFYLLSEFLIDNIVGSSLLNVYPEDRLLGHMIILHSVF